MSCAVSSAVNVPSHWLLVSMVDDVTDDDVTLASSEAVMVGDVVLSVSCST